MSNEKMLTIPAALLRDLIGDVEDYSISREFKRGETAWRQEVLAEARALLSTPPEQAGAGQARMSAEMRVAIQECIDYLRPVAKEFADLDMGDSKHARCIRTLRTLLETPQPEPRAEVTDDKRDKTTGLIKTLSDIIHDQTVAMQSAIIEWQHGNGAEAGLSWIVNTLEGPGHFPDFDAPHGKHAQFWFNANQANPLPVCFCGNPSSSLWMGQGFCCDEHYREAKAKHDAARSGESHD